MNSKSGERPAHELPAFAWPGGYPIVYLTRRGECLCPECAGQEHDIPRGDVHWEGEPLTCDECGADVESAYGPVDGD
jgi:hypothetical protein